MSKQLQYDLFGEPSVEPNDGSPMESIVAGALFDFAAFIEQTSDAALNWAEAIRNFAEYRELYINQADPMWELALKDDRKQ